MDFSTPHQQCTGHPTAQPRNPGGFLTPLPETEAPKLGRSRLPPPGASDRGLGPAVRTAQASVWAFLLLFKMWLPSSGGNAADLRPRNGNPITNHPGPALGRSPSPATCPGDHRAPATVVGDTSVRPGFAATTDRPRPSIAHGHRWVKKADLCPVGFGSQSKLHHSLR